MMLIKMRRSNMYHIKDMSCFRQRKTSIISLRWLQMKFSIRPVLWLLVGKKVVCSFLPLRIAGIGDEMIRLVVLPCNGYCNLMDDGRMTFLPDLTSVLMAVVKYMQPTTRTISGQDATIQFANVPIRISNIQIYNIQWTLDVERLHSRTNRSSIKKYNGRTNYQTTNAFERGRLSRIHSNRAEYARVESCEWNAKRSGLSVL